MIRDSSVCVILLDRIEQTRRDIEEVSQGLSSWLKDRTDEDKKHQYLTQLGTLEQVLGEGIRRLETALNNLEEARGLALGSVYGRCRQIDKGLSLVRRVWGYYRSKFDQRDTRDETVRGVLAAADEIVWSCYKEAFRNQAIPMRATPLPFIDAEYSPAAIPRLLLPREFKGVPAVLGDWLRELPIPLVSMPVTCVREPWRLAHLAHEVGHHVQYDLVEEWKLVGDGYSLVSAAGAGGDGSGNWGQWSVEIFADAFSICMLGPWAVWALVDLELDEPLAMLKPKPGGASGLPIGNVSYPPPLVRLVLAAKLAEALGVRGDNVLRGFGIDPSQPEVGGDARVAADVSTIPRVVEALRSPLPGLGERLERVTDWDAVKLDFAPGARVASWIAGWLDEAIPTPQPDLRSARLLLSSAAGAWSRLAIQQPDVDVRQRVREHIAARLPGKIVAVREGGDRAEQLKGPGDLAGLGEQLVRMALEEGWDG
jgi:hypothetical protein